MGQTTLAGMGIGDAKVRFNERYTSAHRIKPLTFSEVEPDERY